MGEITYISNALNQYTQVGSTAPIYDVDGNILSGLISTSDQNDRNMLAFEYNSEDRPVCVSSNGVVSEGYSYDHNGRRIRKGNTVILYDENNAIAEYDGNNIHVLKKTYAWGYDLSGSVHGAGGVGGLLSVTEYDSQMPLTSYPCYDGDGNITEYITSEGDGNLVVHYEYDAFGKVIKKTGNKNYCYQFSTKPFDDLTGLNYYNYRYYDSDEGRWCSRDMFFENGGINLYCFLGNNAFLNYDFLGLSGYKVLGDAVFAGGEKVVKEMKKKYAEDLKKSRAAREVEHGARICESKKDCTYYIGEINSGSQRTLMIGSYIPCKDGDKTKALVHSHPKGDNGLSDDDKDRGRDGMWDDPDSNKHPVRKKRVVPNGTPVVSATESKKGVFMQAQIQGNLYWSVNGKWKKY